MDDLLREFLTETHESIDVVDVELVRFEQDPNNAQILGNVFRLVHTIKGTCGFLGLPRLEALTHAAEALIGQFRDGMPVTGAAVTLILATIDRIKALLDAIERNQGEEPGNDDDLITELNRMAAAPLSAGHSPVSLIKATGKEPRQRAEIASLDQTERQVATTARESHAKRAEATPDTTEPSSPAAKTATRRAPGPHDEDTRRDEPRPDGKLAQQSIRVQVDTLERLMTMVSELVLTRNQLLDIVRRHEDSEFKAPLQRLSNVTAELQEGVMKTRMQPIGNAWQKLPRIVRDLSTELGKQVEFEMQGAETELDRQVLDLIKDPLAHMVRNSLDHGVETPPERRAAGKPDKATLRLSARHEGGHIIVEIADDGRGLDTARIRAKAIALGLAPEAEIEKMSDALVHRYIFTPGFSTVDRVTNVSGRGIGMDVVRANIEQIGGTIDLKSIAGSGTSFIIKIPLTLAIISALIVEIAGNRYAIPQLAVVELVSARSNSEHRIERIKDAAVLRLRDKLLPLVSIKRLLKIADGDGKDIESGFIVVTQVGGQMFGMVVDGVFHTEEIVVKPMSSKLRHIPVFCGNTILGDGSVIMIIDPNGIAHTIGGTASARAAAEDARAGTARADERASTESLLVFRAGSPHPKAVLLSLVTRLEEIDARTIEMSSGRPLVQYRGQLMPLVPANDEVRIKPEGAQPLLVFVDEGRSMALVVDEIVDIVEERLEIELASERPGVLGSAVVKGQATEVIDVAHFLPLAFEDWRDWRIQRGGRTMRRLLLVDDAPFFRHMLTPVLKAAGFTVTAVGSGSEALALMAETRFDIVVTDIEMPGMNGFELAAAMRANPETADVPIIGLSSLVSAEAVERGRQVGLYDYVAKFDRQGLIAALNEQGVEMVRAA